MLLITNLCLYGAYYQNTVILNWEIHHWALSAIKLSIFFHCLLLVIAYYRQCVVHLCLKYPKKLLH